MRLILIVDGYAALLRARRWRRRWEEDTRRQYERHRWWGEGVHGEAKPQHGLRRAVRRALANVAIQAYLTALVFGPFLYAHKPSRPHRRKQSTEGRCEMAFGHKQRDTLSPNKRRMKAQTAPDFFNSPTVPSFLCPVQNRDCTLCTWAAHGEGAAIPERGYAQGRGQSARSHCRV